MINPNDQAFPRNYAFQNPGAGESELRSIPGLTKREHFAAMAMQSFVHAYSMSRSMGHENFAIIAEASLVMADALIDALNKKAAAV